MSRTCNVKDMIVVLNRLVLNLLPDSMRLSSNIGFSYTTPYENLDTGRILFAPALSSFLALPTPASAGRSMILRHMARIQTLTFSFGCAGPLPDRSGIAIGFLPRPPRQSW